MMISVDAIFSTTDQNLIDLAFSFHVFGNQQIPRKSELYIAEPTIGKRSCTVWYGRSWRLDYLKRYEQILTS